MNLLLKPVPATMATRCGCMEDDEFILRAAEHYGASEIVKLRYIIARFDVGEMSGGLQSAGLLAAKARQLAESEELMAEMPGQWEWVRSHAKGQANSRLSGLRVRMSPSVISMEHMHGMALQIEECVRERQK